VRIAPVTSRRSPCFPAVGAAVSASALIVEGARWMSSQGYESIGMSSLADAERVHRESWFVRLGFVDSGGGMFMASTQALA
jgi:hypothetical protein